MFKTTLSTAELLFLEHFHKIHKKILKQSAEDRDVYDLLENMIKPRKEKNSSFSLFFKSICLLSLQDPVLEYWCRKFPLENYWIKQWNSRPEAESAQYDLLPQRGIKNFDLVRGEMLYDLYDKKNEFLYLKKAIELNNFHALKKLIHLIFEFLKTEITEDSLTETFKRLTTLKKDLEFHGTPGCLLLAGAYLKLSTLYKTHFKKTREENLPLYLLAYEQRYAAYLLYNHSLKSVHNATAGLGIESMMSKKTIRLSRHCEDLANNASLTTEEILNARKNALALKKQYLENTSASQITKPLLEPGVGTSQINKPLPGPGVRA